MARKASRTSPKSASKSTSSRQPRSSRGGMALYSDVLGIANGLLRSRKDAGSDKISSLANTARAAAEDLIDIPAIQTYAAGVATQLEHLSTYVSDTELEDMVDDAMQFAKDNPISTFAFAVAAGYGLTRLMTTQTRADREVRKTAPAPRKRQGAKRSSNVRTKANGKAAANGAVHAS